MPAQIFPHERAAEAARSLVAAGVLAGAAFLGCEAEPVYVGVAEPAPSSCESDCFADEAVSARLRGALDEPREATLSAPVWVYPLEGAMLVRNLPDLRLQFRRAPGQTAFRIDFRGSGVEQRLYVPCLSSSAPDECSYQVPARFWDELSQRAFGREIEIELRGTDGARSSRSARRVVTFSPSDVLGGLYYWSSELRGLYRVTFGGRRAVPYLEPSTPESPDACAGCHAVSRDGKVVAFTSGPAEESGVFENAAFEGRLTVTDTDRPTSTYLSSPPTAQSDSGMIALNADGTRVVTAFDHGIVLRDARTGSELARLDRGSLPEGRSPYFPEISPDGKALVVTMADRVDSEIAVASGSIGVIELAGDTFGTARTVVPESPDAYHYYPTWSPDGRWIAFVSAPAAATKSYDQPASTLRLVSADGGEVFTLDNASGPAGSTTTWPKFSPFAQCPDGSDACAAGERIFFLTFSSKRDYGFLLKNSQSERPSSQLWLSAVALGRLNAAGEAALDPSLPPVWIPYQDVRTHNHLGYWTEVVRCGPELGCDAAEDCVGHQCIVIR